MQYRKAVPVLALLALAACVDRGPTKPARFSPSEALLQSQAQVLPQFPEMPDSLPETRIAAADRQTSPELSDTALMDAISRSGGKVMIGLKPTSAGRTRETGVIPGISRATALAARAAIQALGANIVRTYRYTSAVSATIRPTLGPALRRLPVVDYVEPIFSGRVMSQDTGWGAIHMRTPLVWAGYYGNPTHGEGAWVTMLDQGVDSIHRWYGDGPANMYLDCYWIDSTGSSCYANAQDSKRIGHGSHVAGDIAALDNSIGIIGIAPNPAGFASIKVCDSFGNCQGDWVASGLDWAISQSTARPRQIVNMSLGFCSNSPYIAQAVATAANAGILLVASAGNYQLNETEADACQGQSNDLGTDWRTGVMYPARYSQVMAVSGTLENDEFAIALSNPGGGGGSPPPGGSCKGGACGVPGWCADGSRSGPQVSVAAPFTSFSMETDNSYGWRCGTSMSAAYVTGVAALVWSHNPGMTSAQVRVRLQSTAVFISPSSEYGSGVVDAANAVYNLTAPPPSIGVSITGASLAPAHHPCTWTAGAWGGTEPYSYSWTVNGAPAGDGSETLTISTPSSNFVIIVTAVDANDYTGTSGLTVTVGGGNCNEQ
jgi:subtilisin